MREPDGSLSFAAAKAPTDEEVEALGDVDRARILRLLVRQGLLSDEAGDGVNEPETPPLHALVLRHPFASGSPWDRARVPPSSAWETRQR